MYYSTSCFDLDSKEPAGFTLVLHSVYILLNIKILCISKEKPLSTLLKLLPSYPVVDAVSQSWQALPRQLDRTRIGALRLL